MGVARPRQSAARGHRPGAGQAGAASHPRRADRGADRARVVRLFDRMRALKARGVAIIFVSHRLAEVFAICRPHRRHARRPHPRRPPRRRRDAPGGRRRDDRRRFPPRRRRRAPRRPATSRSSIARLSVFDAERAAACRRARSRRRKGEVVGLFGLLGAGCIEAALAMYGAWPGPRERRDPRRRRASRRSAAPTHAVALGLGLIAQDRRDCLIGEQSIADNIVIASLGRIARHGVLDIAPAGAGPSTRSRALDIKAASIDAEVGTLSRRQPAEGADRALACGRGRILIMIDPTRGVDVGARREIKRIWSDLGAQRPGDPARLDRRRGTGRHSAIASSC